MEKITLMNDGYSFDKLNVPGIEKLQDYWCDLEKERNSHVGKNEAFITEMMINFESQFKEIIPAIEKELEEAARHLIGSTLLTPGGNYEITMVEIYADGLWDRTGDYLKYHFKYYNSKSVEKLKKGPRLYFFGGRLDIKLFQENLPFSFLIRNLRRNDEFINENLKIGSAYPGYLNGGYGKLFWIDEHKLKTINPDELVLHWDGIKSNPDPKYRKDLKEPSKLKRIESGRPTGLNGKYKDREWNFCLKV